MANRYQSDERSHRYGAQRGYDRQAEQFQSDYDDERGSRQQGESWRDQDYAQQAGWESDERYDRYDRESRDTRSPASERYAAGRTRSSGYGPSRYTPGGGRSFASFTGNDFGGGDFSRGTGGYDERTASGRAGSWGAGSYGAGSWLGENHGEWRDRAFDRERGYARGGDDDRGLLERAGDAVARWFGDEDDGTRRRESYRGHGPANYTRTDERIREDASERLTDDWSVDARKIEVKVSGGEITLDGTVGSRDQKRRAEDLVENLSGVKHVQNNLRVDTGTWGGDATTTASDANKTTTSR